MTKSKSHSRNPIRHIVYPSGVKDITQDLPKDELVRRLKMLARSFQDMEQEEDNSQYDSLAIHITDHYFLKHSSKDVRLLVACCVADVFRIFAPEAPYKTDAQLKTIFKFLCEQLWDLEDTTSHSWKRYFYLLENLAMVKSFNICMELQDANEIFVRLFTIFFSIVNKNHPPKVRGFMLDVMCPLISENDSVSPDLLEVILKNLVKTKKVDNPFATLLAKDLIKRTATSIEPAMQAYFNNALVLGKSSESELSRQYTYELIYQLNLISNNLLLAVLPQLEFKLKTSEEKERLAVTKLLGRMFSDKDSDLAATNKPLWHCFLGRFSDITAAIRIECVKYVPTLLVGHSHLVEDLADRLRERAHDVEDDVRLETVQSLVSSAKKDITVVADDMLQLVKERTLDKKWKIRKEAILGLAHIYKKWCHSEDIAEKDRDRLLWIKDKILHSYYLPDLEDRLLVERIFTMNLVPYTLPVTERMGRFLELFVTVDDNSVKAIIELIKCQHIVRTHLRDLLEALKTQTDGEQNKTVFTKVVAISKCLPENSKTQDHLKKMVKALKEDDRLMASMVLVVSHDVTCKRAAFAVGEIMKKFASPKQHATAGAPGQPIYNTIKTLMERVAPLIQDGEATQEFLGILARQMGGVAPTGIRGARHGEVVERGLRLLQMLTHVYPYTFKSEESLGHLVEMVQLEGDDEAATVSEAALKTLAQVTVPYEDHCPDMVKELCKILTQMALSGSRKQAKHAIRCINSVCTTSRKEMLDTIFKRSQESLSLDHEHYLTALTAVAHIARLAPDQFLGPMKAVIAGTVVKGILMQDRTEGSKSKGIWCLDDQVCEETQGKLLAMKVLVHWLLGLGKNISGSVISTVRLLTTMLKNDGDLMERKKTGRADMSRLRLGAGCALLKLAQEPAFTEFISLEQFQLIALLINDECFQVRERFADKLHQGLTTLRLPLSYMSILSLCSKDPVKENHKKAASYIKQSVAVRRQYLKQHNLTGVSMLAVLPEYVIPHTVHLLSHDPDFVTPKDLEALKDIKDCLWFILEPLASKPESVSFIRKMLLTIKQMKDAQAVEEKQNANKKLYAVCEVGLGLLTTKLPGMVIKDHPGDIVLPNRLYVKPKRPVNSRDSYLPKKLQQEFSQAENSSSESQEENATDKKAGGKGAAAAAVNKNKKPSSGDENQSPLGQQSKAAGKKEANQRKVLTQKGANDSNGGRRSKRAQASPSKTPVTSPSNSKMSKPKTKQTSINKYVTPKQKRGASTPQSPGQGASSSEPISTPSPAKRRKVLSAGPSAEKAGPKKGARNARDTKSTEKESPTKATASKDSPTKKAAKTNPRGAKALLLNAKDKGEKKMVRTNKVATIKRVVNAVSRTRAGSPQKRLASTPLGASPQKKSKASPSKMESPVRNLSKITESPSKASPTKTTKSTTKAASKTDRSRRAPSTSPEKSSQESPAKSVRRPGGRKTTATSSARGRKGPPASPSPSPPPSPSKRASPAKKAGTSPAKRAAKTAAGQSQAKTRGRQPVQRMEARGSSVSPARSTGSPKKKSVPSPAKKVGKKAGVVKSRQPARNSAGSPPARSSGPAQSSISSRSKTPTSPAKKGGRGGKTVSQPESRGRQPSRKAESRESSSSPSASPPPSSPEPTTRRGKNSAGRGKQNMSAPRTTRVQKPEQSSNKVTPTPRRGTSKSPSASPAKNKTAAATPKKSLAGRSPAKKRDESPAKNNVRRRASPAVIPSTRSARSDKRKITPARRYSPSGDEVSAQSSPSKSPAKSPRRVSRPQSKSPSRASPVAKRTNAVAKSPPKVRRVAGKNAKLPKTTVGASRKGRASPSEAQSPAAKKNIRSKKPPTKETVKRRLVDSESEAASTSRSVSSAASSPRRSPSPQKSSSPRKSLTKSSPKKNVRQAANTRVANKGQGKGATAKRKAGSRSPTPSPKKRKVVTPTKSPRKSSPEKSTLNISRKSHRRRKSKP